MTKVRGDLKGKHVAASFDGPGKKPFIGKLKETQALVLLSIRGNPYCTGEYLTAIAEHAVANHRKATFLIADEVYWNNLKEPKDTSEERIAQLKQEALILGDQYIQDNLAAFLKPLELTVEEFQKQYANASIDMQIVQINRLAAEKGLNFELVRWQTWVSHDSYRALERELQDYYDSDVVLKRSINNTATDFSRRHKQDGGEALWFERSRSYLREESPAVIWLAAKLGYQFIAYPGDMIESFKATKAFFISNEGNKTLPEHVAIVTQASLVNWLDVNFRRSYSTVQQVETLAQTAMSNLPFFNQNKSKVQIRPCNIELENYTQELAKSVFANSDIDTAVKIDVLINVLMQLKQNVNLDNSCNLPSHHSCQRVNS